MHFMTITSTRRTPGKLIDTRQNLQSIQPTFLETGILFYSTGALILTNGRSYQEQQNCYLQFFWNIIFISVFYHPIN
jgi:hypothetical protein